MSLGYEADPVLGIDWICSLPRTLDFDEGLCLAHIIRPIRKAVAGEDGASV